MRKLYSALLAMAALFGANTAQAQAPCTTTNATGCLCRTSGQVDCDLLPDITISGWAILNYLGGPTEYSQSGNGANDGRLRVSGSTPNIGYGAFTVGAVNMWVCGLDTFTSYSTAQAQCANPTQLIKQKIYHKNNGTMTYSERWAGGMTYHPTHGHMHVDDWATFTLRTQTADPNPLNWPIVGDGSKIGFCLMDYGTCTNYNGHCRDGSNNVMLNGDFNNWGLGGGQYNCSPVEQGISVGHTDIYSENLDGMWIDIPPGTCNGNYYIVMEVDPNNNFLEENETNNVAAVPFTLTQQVPSGQYVAGVTASGTTSLCAGDAVTLTASPGTSYLWSNGATTASITATQAGTYTVTVTAPCGTDVSDPVTVTVSNTTTAPTANGDVICAGQTATLTVNSGPDVFEWYDAPVGGNLVGTGLGFTTPQLFSNTDYYVQRIQTTPGQLYNFGPNPSQGSGAFHTINTRYITFDAMKDIVLKSVMVDALTAGNRDIELRDGGGNVLQTATVFVPQGQSRVTLNFAVPIGVDYQLGLGSNSTTDLYRNDGGVNYPYSVSNVVQITGSSAGGQYYYFFYEWEVSEADMVCATPRATATATVTPGPAVTVTGLAANYTTVDPMANLVGNPAGGTFSGPGISGSTFSPALAGAGTHTITYTYTDVNGCIGSTDITTIVSPGVSILNGVFASEPAVYPNPNNGEFTLSFSIDHTHDVAIRILNMTGQVVQDRQLGAFSGIFAERFSLGGTAHGIYFVEVEVDGMKYRSKVAYQ
jgi:Ig-like domain CHU_C associated/Lysyl oxidase/Secretion system C-terminal sorting domain